MCDCIFCKIVKNEVPSKKLYEDDNFIIIKNISPKTKIHLLLIPKEHYAGFFEQNEEQALKLGLILNKLPSILNTLGFKNGFRLQINQGKDAGQSVFHLHVHIMGGEKLQEF